MSSQKIPRVTSYMVSQQPDQLSDILNRIIEKINLLDD